MKLITCIFALIFALSAFAEIELVNSSNSLKYDGTVDANALEQRFVKVLNNAGYTIESGKTVVLDATADDGASVTLSTTVGLSPMCVMAESCADNKLCKCQTYGLMDAAYFDALAGNATAGKRFYLSSANAGYIAARVTELATEAPGGVFYDAATASGSIQVFIDL